jgi:hypothetical protein
MKLSIEDVALAEARLVRRGSWRPFLPTLLAELRDAPFKEIDLLVVAQRLGYRLDRRKLSSEPVKLGSERSLLVAHQIHSPFACEGSRRAPPRRFVRGMVARYIARRSAGRACAREGARPAAGHCDDDVLGS